MKKLIVLIVLSIAGCILVLLDIIGILPWNLECLNDQSKITLALLLAITSLGGFAVGELYATKKDGSE